MIMFFIQSIEFAFESDAIIIILYIQNPCQMDV
jgi:hypothetical protein